MNNIPAEHMGQYETEALLEWSHVLCMSKMLLFFVLTELLLLLPYTNPEVVVAGQVICNYLYCWEQVSALCSQWWSQKHQPGASRYFFSPSLHLLSGCTTFVIGCSCVCVCMLTDLHRVHVVPLKLEEAINSRWIALRCQLTKSGVTHQPGLHENDSSSQRTGGRQWALSPASVWIKPRRSFRLTYHTQLYSL